MKPFGAVDVGLEKRLPNSSFRVSYNDIFGTNKYRFLANIPSENLDTDARLDFETTILNVTYTQNFGNNKLKGRRSGKSGSKEERERLN